MSFTESLHVDLVNKAFAKKHSIHVTIPEDKKYIFKLILVNNTSNKQQHML